MNQIAKCSFCQKSQKSVDKLIAGPKDIYICNECIDICNITIGKSSTQPKEPTFDITEETMFCATLRYFDDQTIEDMKKWLDANVKGSWINEYTDTIYNIKYYKIIFENESDLVAFKLRWF